MLLSIDVGIRNLAMCLVDETDKRIVEWDVSGVPPEHKDGLFISMRDHLDNRPWILDANTILIEKQPGQNKKMKSVENFLHAYFIIKLKESETIIYDARHKVPDVVGTGKTLYRKRKQTAIKRCEETITNDGINTQWLELFKKSKKKDDLADTYLQALSYINRIVPKEKEEKKKKAGVKPRKPTENQKETKYSKSNLAWFFKNNTKEELEKNKRFQKDLKRYYSDVKELEKDII
jgi:hypothetical protein